jgi:hypothetical protein
VVNVEVKHYEGPVYDMETARGYMVANGLLISNCMCWRRAIVRPESDWGDPMPEPERAEVPDESEVAEALRKWSGEEGRKITENFARRQRERAAEHIRLGAENAIPASE